MRYYLIIMCLNQSFAFFLKNLKTLDRTAQQVSCPTCEPEQSISQSLNQFNQLISPFLIFRKKYQLNKDMTLN